MGRPGRRGTGRLPWRQPSQPGAPAGLLALLPGLLLALLVSGCTSAGPPASAPSSPPTAAAGCGPLAAEDVRGRTPPRHRGVELTPYAADGAACIGVWLPTGDGFVPQGLAVAGRTAWVSGVDANDDPKTCVVLRVALDSGEVRDRLDLPRCWHGGGLALDEHGLWLVDTGQLLLLDESDLRLLRTWRVRAPVRGSFATLDEAGRLGLGGWLPHRRGSLHWLEPETLLAPGVSEIEADLAVEVTGTPSRAQGAVVLTGRGAGLWFARSVTRCGVLVGPGGRRRAFVPGAEGMARAGDDAVWVVSEAGSAYYQVQGGRPVVPTLVRFDVDELLSGARPDCAP